MNPTEVSVRLTAAGKEAAGGGTLLVHGGQRELSFTGDAVQTVRFSDWNQVLRSTAPYGKPFFEIVQDAAPAPAGTPTLVPPKTTKPVSAPTEGEAAK
jgi:hypothetical protein